MERGWKPNVEMSPNCPRCGSSNTKFCYYNNYSLTQPRYFCKSCRRYWTKGGSLRNVPVGGGCRKNRRGKSLTLTPSASQLKFHSNNDNCLGFGCVPNGSQKNPDGSQDIDLAIVYANFLNQKPDSKDNKDMPELKPCDDSDPCLQFSAYITSNTANNFSVPDENSMFGCSTFCDFSMQEYSLGVDDQVHCFGLESSVEQKNQVDKIEEARQLGLPPLPGEDMVGWSSSLIMVNHRLQPARVDMLGMEAQDPNLLSGNWSPIDLSSYDTFSRA